MPRSTVWQVNIWVHIYRQEKRGRIQEQSVELALEKQCVKLTWSCLNSSNAVVKNICPFVLGNQHFIFGNNLRYFSYKYTFIEVIGSLYNNTVTQCLRYDYIICDLCSIRNYDSTCILTSTFLIEYIYHITYL